LKSCFAHSIKGCRPLWWACRVLRPSLCVNNSQTFILKICKLIFLVFLMFSSNKNYWRLPHIFFFGRHTHEHCLAVPPKARLQQYSSQDLWLTFRRSLNNVDRDLFTTSVYPSVCGWQVVEKRSLIPSLAHKVFQKWLRNLSSLSDTIVLGKPWSLTTCLKKSLDMWLASSTLWHGVKWAILLNLSTTTKIEATPL